MSFYIERLTVTGVGKKDSTIELSNGVNIIYGPSNTGKDLSKGAIKRKERGLPEEYLYVFKYTCRLFRRDAHFSELEYDDILIYIKVNDRKIPYKKVYVISFHKNNPKEK